MNSNITRMREKLEKLKMRRTSLRIEAKGIARSIPEMINPALVEIEEMENLVTAAAKMDELVVKQAELLGIRSKIWELEEALG